MLMHADNRRINHLHRRIMGGGQRVHDPAPDTSPSPANEAVVAGGVRTRHAVSTGSVRGFFWSLSTQKWTNYAYVEFCKN
jgi:hypothetical protein